MRSRPARVGRRRGFTLIEILVAVGVLAILGTALVGLMSAAVGAWRRGEASRQVEEKHQALRRQLEEDFAAAVLDPPPVPDFHYALDTLWDLPTDPADPYYIVEQGSPEDDVGEGYALRYFAPGPSSQATVVLRIRVPFVVQAALLKARLDVFHPEAWAALDVAPNDPHGDDPEAPPPSGDPRWVEVDYLEGEGIAGGERDISEAVRGGDIVFVRATLSNTVEHTAQFLRGDLLRSEGRPVLILDAYREPDAVSQRPRPVFQAYWKAGRQVLSFSRTIPGETEKAALRQAGSGSEYLNYFDDDGDGAVDNNLRSLGGRAQVLYYVVPYPPEAGKPGMGVLRRAFEAPLGRPMADIPAHDFIPNVLYFGVTFWGGDTTTWELRPELDPDYDPALPPHPASRRWLSSRYLPEEVQVTVVVEPDRGKRVFTTLNAAVDADFPASGTARLQVQSTEGFYRVDRTSDAFQQFLRDPRHYIKIGEEWIHYERVASPTEFVIAAEGRGARGTTPSAHPVGAEVYRGSVSVFALGIPAYRHWQR
ncbi:MAG: type II secretion system protein J [Candidatus Brocadiia bacterium]